MTSIAEEGDSGLQQVLSSFRAVACLLSSRAGDGPSQVERAYAPSGGSAREWLADTLSLTRRCDDGDARRREVPRYGVDLVLLLTMQLGGRDDAFHLLHPGHERVENERPTLLPPDDAGARNAPDAAVGEQVEHAAAPLNVRRIKHRLPPGRADLGSTSGTARR